MDFTTIFQLALPVIFLLIATPKQFPRLLKIVFIILALVTVAFYGGCAIVAAGFGQAVSGAGSGSPSGSEAIILIVWSGSIILWSVIILVIPDDKEKNG